MAVILELANAGWHHGHWWWIWIPLTWALLITLAVLFLRRSRTHTPTTPDPAGAILAERYARGEITADEYRERLETLRHSPGP